MDLQVPDETTSELLIRYGLYLGAVFQLICIAAVIILPDKTVDGASFGKCGGDLSEDEIWEGSPSSVTPRHAHSHSRMKKQDKKKRR